MRLNSVTLAVLVGGMSLCAAPALAQEETDDTPQWREVTPERPAEPEPEAEEEAEAEPRVAPARPTAAETPRVVQPERDESVSVAKRPLDPGLRVLREVGVGVLGTGVGALVGGLAGMGLFCAAGSSGGWCALFGALIGGTVGGTLGAGLGVRIGGDERGAWWAAVLGAGLGAAVAIPTLQAVPYLPLAFPVVGALLFYEISRAFSGPDEAGRPRSGAVRSRLMSVAPFTTRDGGGGLMVSGLF